MKSRSYYLCQNCGYQSPSFLGKCPNCGKWNTLVETKEASLPSWGKAKREKKIVSPFSLAKITTAGSQRIKTQIEEFDQVIGGGLVPGSVILLAGDPGIGKSTLTLQIAAEIPSLYVTGEESLEQVKLRAERLRIPFSEKEILVLAQTNVELILSAAEEKKEKIRLLIIDSIQTLWSEELSGAPGAVGQVRECALKLLEFAKKEKIPVILIGHVTKEGTIAGPKVLEHIVDTVLYLEGERFQSLRLLRTTKNRFGAVDEVGVFSLEEQGLKEVKNPSEIFLGSPKEAAGSVVVAALEGSRPFLVEVQALTVATKMPLPKRVGTGIRNDRLQMLVAILQKHLKLPLFYFDIFVNVASGLKIFEPAADLGICLALISSLKNKPLPPKTVAIGEVGLLGEVRNVIGQERRIKEAKRLGFTQVLSYPTYQNLRQLLPLFSSS